MDSTDRRTQELNRYEEMLKNLHWTQCHPQHIGLDAFEFYHCYGQDIMTAVKDNPGIRCHPFIRFGAQEGRGELRVERQEAEIAQYEDAGDGFNYWFHNGLVQTESYYDGSIYEHLTEAKHSIFTELNASEFYYLQEAWKPEEALERIQEIRKGWIGFQGDTLWVIEVEKDGGFLVNDDWENDGFDVAEADGGVPTWYAIGFLGTAYGIPTGRASKEVYRTLEDARIALDEGTWTKLERPQRSLWHFFVEEQEDLFTLV